MFNPGGNKRIHGPGDIRAAHPFSVIFYNKAEFGLSRKGFAYFQFHRIRPLFGGVLGYIRH